MTVEEVTDSTAQLSWSPGRDNGSPITSYIVQARTAFTVGWQAVDTGTTLPPPPASPHWFPSSTNPTSTLKSLAPPPCPAGSAGVRQRQHADGGRGGTQRLGGVRVPGGGTQRRGPRPAQPALRQDSHRGRKYVASCAAKTVDFFFFLWPPEIISGRSHQP